MTAELTMSTSTTRERDDAFACEQCLDLRTCQPGTACIVRDVVRTEHNAGAVRRLAELGLRRGATITAGQKTPGGGRVIGVADAWLALDAHTLASMQVTAARA